MIKKYKQFNEGIKHLLVGPTKDQVEKDMKNKYYNNEITLSNYLQKCDEYKIQKPTKNEVLMKLGITDKNETEQINTGEDFINFIIDNTDSEHNYNNKNILYYKLYYVIYFCISKKAELCVISRENMYDVLNIFDIVSVNEKIELMEKIFIEKGLMERGWRLITREKHLMFC